MKNHRELKHLAQRLAHLSQMLSAGAETPAEYDQFYKLLDKVFELEPVQETVVCGTALTILADMDDNDSVQWLTEELRDEATLQWIPTGSGRDRASLMFLIPVVLSDTDTLNAQADQELLGELHEILQEADVIDSAADFGLCPRILAFNDIFAKSYGELRRLNRYLGEQVLQGEKVIMLPDTFELPEHPDGASCMPGTQLFFVLGLATTRGADLENVFPNLSNEIGPDENGERERGFAMTEQGPVTYDMLDSGLTVDGKPWEYAFCQAFDDAFGTIEGSYTALPPDGMAEDLLRGLELAREVGLCQMFERNFDDESQKRWARISVLQESEGECWFDVHCQSAPEVEPLETVRWPVLLQETEDEALDKLIDTLEEANVELENPPPPSATFGSMLLH